MKAPGSLFAQPFPLSKAKLLFIVGAHIFHLPFCYKLLVLQNLPGNLLHVG